MPKVLESMPKQQQPVVESPPQVVTTKRLRPVLWPDVMVSGIVIPRTSFKVTVAQAKDMLGFETESEYADRQIRLGRTTSRELARFRPPGNDARGMTAESVAAIVDEKERKKAKQTLFLSTAHEYDFVGPGGEKCKCWHNINNRPLRESWMKDIADDILNRAWRMNCETVIISKTGLVLSGQHRLLGLIWAWMLWSGKDSHRWRLLWPEEPYIESLVVVGSEEDEETLMTLDNTLARTEADNFITTDLIDWLKPGPNNKMVPLSSVNKNECAKMLEQANKFLWRRTGVSDDSTSRRKTSQASMGFAKRHSTILKCIRHVWEENSGDGRAISSMSLSPGQCAGMLYLMGSGNSDGDYYRRRASTTDRNEDRLEWTLLERAKEFFSLLAASDPDFQGNTDAKNLFRPLRRVFGLVVDPTKGEGGSDAEHSALLAKAWAAWRATGKIEEADLVLRYDEERDSEGNLKSRKLDECPLFNVPSRGIDIGDKVKSVTTGPAPTPEQIRESEAAARRRHEDETAQRLRESQARSVQLTPAEQQKATLAKIKADCGNRLVIIKTVPANNLVAIGIDAMILAKTCGLSVNDNVDPCRLVIDKKDAKVYLDKIGAKHSNVVVAVKATVPAGHKDEGRYYWELLPYTGPERPDGTPTI